MTEVGAGVWDIHYQYVRESLVGLEFQFGCLEERTGGLAGRAGKIMSLRSDSGRAGKCQGYWCLFATSRCLAFLPPSFSSPPSSQ